MNDTDVLRKESERVLFLFPPNEDTMRSLQPGRGSSMDHAGTQILEF